MWLKFLELLTNVMRNLNKKALREFMRSGCSKYRSVADSWAAVELLPIERFGGRSDTLGFIAVL